MEVRKSLYIQKGILPPSFCQVEQKNQFFLYAKILKEMYSLDSVRGDYYFFK